MTVVADPNSLASNRCGCSEAPAEDAQGWAVRPSSSALYIQTGALQGVAVYLGPAESVHLRKYRAGQRRLSSRHLLPARGGFGGRHRDTSPFIGLGVSPCIVRETWRASARIPRT